MTKAQKGLLAAAVGLVVLMVTKAAHIDGFSILGLALLLGGLGYFLWQLAARPGRDEPTPTKVIDPPDQG